ncbi:MAG: NADH-quinone oxidoreductase subunit L [Arcticibacterium sp.]|jgi:NADH-quinone oxidoreductase subunit L
MSISLILFLIIPFLTFLGSLPFKNRQEKMIGGIANTGLFLQTILSISLFAFWALNGFDNLEQFIFSVYRNKEFNFGLTLYYDKLTAVFSVVSSILMFLVSVFSKTYMHRESGFQRFYNHFLFFNFGLNLLIFSGNFETFFLGWEIVGITSFLLIAFYRDRYLPVKNGMKVLTFYRIGDAALIGGIWFSHHLFQENVVFSNFINKSFVFDAATHIHPLQGLMIALLFILAAAVKSAQFPFSNWLPRAFEGPTVSSAIFYGAIAVHVGVFLLLRTYPLWHGLIFPKYAIISMGLISALLGTLIGMAQPTAKTQIAYSSIANIGLIMIEIALGWHILALIHFATNACLRTYQILTSPSAMSYLIHKQVFEYDPNKSQPLRFLPAKWRNALYILSVKEFDLDKLWYTYLWRPLKKLGKSLHFLRHPALVAILILILFVNIAHYFIIPMPEDFDLLFTSGFTSLLALLTIMIAWTERRSALRAWYFIGLSQLFFMFSIMQQHTFDVSQVMLYLSGSTGAFIGGTLSLKRVISKENGINLNEFHGHIYEHPRLALFFLICALTIIGFPISPTFLGFDLLFSDIENNHKLLLLFSSATFIILEFTAIRIYARIFLGPHRKTYHEVAHRSS